jgi:hypothetical protein
MNRCAIVLVHHPVLDGRGDVVTTAVTNLDVHDLARSARSYGCSDYFVAHPITAQRELVTRIHDHWTDGSSGKRIPDRREALSVLRIVDSLQTAIDALGGRERVEIWATAARKLGPTLSFADARERLEAGAGHDAEKTILIVFGTGWGLAPAVMNQVDAILEPIASTRTEYNHLSVRSACAIALDRLFGSR